MVFLACLIPLGQLLYNAWTDDLTANPIEFITHFTGDWSLIFLLATLSVTPLRKILGWNELIKFRRMLGLFAFFYALLHFSTYMVLDHFFDFPAIVKDIIKRPYVTAGFTAFVLMIPLAITSTAAMIRRLGKRWQQLHRLGLHRGYRRRRSFLLVGESRYPPAGPVWRGLGAAARVPIGHNMGAAMAKVPKVPVVPFVQVVVVKTVDGSLNTLESGLLRRPLSGMSINPARTFASAVPAHHWHALWLYFIAPLSGMLSAAEVYVRTRGARSIVCAKLHHENSKRCIFCGKPGVARTDS